ncbi:MAG: pilus assembly protein TadG-related protein [Luteimonas sp.]
MVLFLTLIGVLCLGLLLLFDSSQVVNKKIRLTNTADAAAYSVAVQQAKAYNFAAYMNRAQVANEVAIAQIVSLWSWLNMLHTHTRVGFNTFTYLSGIPVIGAFAAVIARVYQVAEQIVGNIRNIYQQGVTLGGVIPGAEGGLISVLSLLNQGYASANRVVLEYIGGLDGYRLVERVIGENDPTAQMNLLARGLLIDRLRMAAGHDVNGLRPGLLDHHRRPSRRGENHEGMNRFRNVVMGSRDRFTAERGQNIRWWPVSGGTYGGTDMVDYHRWVGMDTMDVRIWMPWPFSDLRIPMGWGGAQAVGEEGFPPFLPGIRAARNNRPGWYSYEHGRDYDQYGGSGGSTARLAEQFPSVNTPWLWGQSNYFTQRGDAYYRDYRGLQDYHDVKPGIARTPDCGGAVACSDAGPVFTVYIHSDRAHARASQDIDGLGSADAGGPLSLHAEMANDRMTAVASAQTYFNRPRDREGLFRRMVPRSWSGQSAPQSDDQLEMGSLFSPYWQARLIDTPMDDYAAIGIDQIVGLP